MAPTVESGELSAWRSYLRGHATVTRALEAELIAEHGLSLAAYDVLAQLAEAPGRRLRMTELAGAVLLSRSGVTRLIDRLERLGLVGRCRVREDGRGVAATLTERGLDALRRASRLYVNGVARHFAERLGPAELRQLRRISQTLAEAGPRPDAEPEVLE
ncbi:DNA-binding MarR family transcriptional regulator [Pseudonocardia eucalypti]|uniref:MarR family winged helix-turn-helix transcriptional regulator n=1 Tax=Pseudonocardia eucalypti TaxID=648755 RepID=UPI001793EAB3|nr:DNA-binding MarR family transcriptional regulator [Pseudonocardia eucalypti]